MGNTFPYGEALVSTARSAGAIPRPPWEGGTICR